MNQRTIRAVWNHWSKGRSTNEIARRMRGREEPEIWKLINDILLARIEGLDMVRGKPTKPPVKLVIELPKGGAA